MSSFLPFSTTGRYPNASELQECLARLDSTVSEPTPRPVYVTMVPVYGGKPPVYAVVLRSRNREKTRQRLSDILKRQLCLGATSFALSVAEAQLVIQHMNGALAGPAR